MSASERERPASRVKRSRNDCGGHRGRAHVMATGDAVTLGKVTGRLYAAGRHPEIGSHLIRYCVTCGKEFDHWFALLGRLGSYEPPQWVIDYRARAATEDT